MTTHTEGMAGQMDQENAEKSILTAPVQILRGCMGSPVLCEVKGCGLHGEGGQSALETTQATPCTTQELIVRELSNRKNLTGSLLGQK